MNRPICSIVLLALCGAILAAAPCAADTEHAIGFGFHYLTVLEDIRPELDEDGISYVLSYRFRPVEYVGIQAEFEVYPDEFLGLEDPIVFPQGFFMLGKTVYVGAGLGLMYYDGEFSSSPTGILRAGLDLELVPHLSVNLHANYLFTEWNDLEDVDQDIDTDTITLGAAARITF
jgi:hypothetical protein